MDQDPLLKFLSTISSKIKVEKEYKSMMEEINNSSNTIVEKDPLRDVLGLLEQKILENKLIIKEEIKVEVVQGPQSIVKTTIEKENTEIELSQEQNINEIVKSNETDADVFGDFINKLKNIVTSKNSSISIEEETVTREPVAPKKQTNDKKVAQVETPSEDNIDTSYINELDKISSDVANENEPGKVSEIKKLIQEYAEKYFKKASIMSSGGGGTMAYNYYNGGTIYGDLNVTGSYLSGGINLYNLLSGSGGGGPTDRLVNGSYQVVLSSNGAVIFPDNTTQTTAFTGNQTLYYSESSYGLSISNGNTVSLSSLSINVIDGGNANTVYDFSDINIDGGNA